MEKRVKNLPGYFTKTISHNIKPFFTNPFYWVGFLTLLGGILRRYHLAQKSLWLDEAVLYGVSQGDVWEILYKNAKMSSAPPLYPLLVNAVQVFGDNEVILRGLAMISSILAIPLAYVVFRKFMSSWAAFLSTFLVTIAPSQIIYAQQVREYSLTFALALGMLLTTWNYIYTSTWRNLTILTLVWSIGIWTQYGLSVLAISLNFIFLLLWLRSRNRELIFRWVIGQIPVLVSVLLTYILALRYQYIVGGFGVQYLGVGYWDPSAISWISFILNQTSDLLKFSFPDPSFFPLVLGIGLISAILEPQKRKYLVWIFTTLGISILLGLLRMYPYLGSRHDLYLTPLLYLLCGLGFDYLLQIDPKKFVAALLLVVMAILGLQANVVFYQSAGLENSRPILAQLNTQIQVGDRVYVYYGGEWAFRYYLRDQKVDWILGKYHRGKPELYLTEVDPLLKSSERVWLFFSHCYQNECDLIRDYAQKTHSVQRIAGDIDVWLYLAQVMPIRP